MKVLKTPHKIGSIFYVLWGILHIVIGLIPVATFLAGGPREMLLAVEGMEAVPAAIEEPLLQASHFIAQHYFNLAAVGILAIIVAVALNWRNHPLGFWTNLIVLGMVDLSFVLGEMVPGYMPVEMGIIGPVLFVLGATFTGYGLIQDREPKPAGQEKQAFGLS